MALRDFVVEILFFFHYLLRTLICVKPVDIFLCKLRAACKTSYICFKVISKQKTYVSFFPYSDLFRYCLLYFQFDKLGSI